MQQGSQTKPATEIFTSIGTKIDFHYFNAQHQFAATLMLDGQGTSAKHARVNSPLRNDYAHWRNALFSPALLREGDAALPPETLLQALWQHQRIRREELHTTDGRAARILHPGFLSRESGPDFRNALVQIGSEPPQAGDIEVDLTGDDWRYHGHDRNPAFQKVVLHVVWEPVKNPRSMLPTLALKPILDAPLCELSTWAAAESPQSLPEALAGRCAEHLRTLSAERLGDLLNQAAFSRLECKARQIQSRAQQAGYEQSLWEGLFRALGYKHNAWPMQCLAELRGRILSAPGSDALSPLHIEARLLGIGGLLPAELTRRQASTDSHLREVWDFWWRDRHAFEDVLLPITAWRLHGLRPANHPQRRLALGARWLADGIIPSKLEQWFAADLSPARAVHALGEVFSVSEDSFWSWHWTLRSARMPRPQPLLGAARVTDLAMNVVLPWLWIRAVEGKNESLRQRAEARYLAWPASEDNSLLKLARRRLLNGLSAHSLSSAAAQQGLIQIVRDFCDHTNSICDNCPFPEHVAGMHRMQ